MIESTTTIEITESAQNALRRVLSGRLFVLRNRKTLPKGYSGASFASEVSVCEAILAQLPHVPFHAPNVEATGEPSVEIGERVVAPKDGNLFVASGKPSGGEV